MILPAVRGTRAHRPQPSIEDVAAAAGVSTATVSRAVRGLPRVAQPTRTRILEIAHALGYAASASAAGLATGRTRSVGVVTSSLRHPAYGAAVEGAERALRSQGYSLVLLHLPHPSASARLPIDLNVLCRRVDALLVLGAGTLGKDSIEQLQRSAMPHMVVGLHGEPDNDELEAATTAIRHLVQLGHTDLALFHGGRGAMPRIRPQAGGLDHRTNSLDANSIKLREIRIEGPAGAIAHSRTAFCRLWAGPGPKPTAIVCASDEMALGVFLEAARKGLTIPKNLSLVGMDGQDLGESLELTAVIHCSARRAANGVQSLLAALEGDHSITHPAPWSPELMIRQSTAAPLETGQQPVWLPQ
ncbi:LacI family transcriptional regulator [Arthrobacter sp. CDRTa11]|uniref:LacI family DNA-binding transcriptional regulator n=1 Tax=Arthrobacter sp. CDRTa11 TaxID=2651199 RepID=UPI002265B8A1|nr:LacI family DNA-binding transcriptional regulator [Arthrobacter sp. CDRTa11]UZX04800.1 LacI family transcriptional regulator [Arthrobacter sp. CDRTa11]